MAVFKNFNWDKTVRDKGNKILEFKKMNVLYGRNYSGKTTLSRILRALEIHSISDKYEDANFEIETEASGMVTQDNLTSYTQIVRVFNEDFVKENLRFLVNESEDIESFAILGDKNIETEAVITTKEKEFGTQEPPSGLLGELKARQSELEAARNAAQKKQIELENLLKRKANDDIKKNSDYKDVNYNINKIIADIKTITNLSFIDIETSEVPNLKLLLKEEPKQHMDEIRSIDIGFLKIAEDVKVLVEKRITLSSPIKDLIENSLLESWVRSGIPYHKNKRTTCGFCGNVLPPNLMTDLDNHFNQESEDLRLKLESLIPKIEDKIKSIDRMLSFDISRVYASEKELISKLEKKYKEFTKDYTSELNKLVDQLKKRLNAISTPLAFIDCNNLTEIMGEIVRDYNDLIKKTNKITTSLSNNQSEARKKLRLHEVCTFLKVIKYSDIQNEIAELIKTEKEAEKVVKQVHTNVSKCKLDIELLKAQLKDEKKGAEQVNKYLNNYFGHNALTLEPVDNENERGKFKFEIRRDGKKAYHLSEGECSLVSFCYFMAKLNDVDTKGNEPIIWIDDPISSLDSNHIFFIYSLINGEIVKGNKFKQLFISTHNLDFLKYLKRLCHERDYGKKMQNFIIHRQAEESTLSEMPEYMVKYVTEFNYLFHKIYQCAHANLENVSDLTIFYDFGNNARKFLELLLSFKYPDPNKSEDKKLESFLRESTVETALVVRINNEYSHLYGVFERGMTPIEIPEMKKTAKFILDKVFENDSEQFNSLLESIGEPPRVAI